MRDESLLVLASSRSFPVNSPGGGTAHSARGLPAGPSGPRDAHKLITVPLFVFPAQLASPDAVSTTAFSPGRAADASTPAATGAGCARSTAFPTRLAVTAAATAGAPAVPTRSSTGSCCAAALTPPLVSARYYNQHPACASYVKLTN